MNISFRQFLEDIEIDSFAYNRTDADERISAAQKSINKDALGRRWRELQVKFPYEGFKVVYRKHERGTFNIMLIDTRDLSGVKVPVGLVLPREKNRVVTELVAEKRSISLPTIVGKHKTLQGLQTTLLSGARDYRGSGISRILYEILVDNGQVLFSSDVQTPGGRAVWHQITQTLLDRADVGVITDNGNYADAERFALVRDTWPVMNRCAYSNNRNFWVIAPAGTLDRYKLDKYK